MQLKQGGHFPVRKEWIRSKDFYYNAGIPLEGARLSKACRQDGVLLVKMKGNRMRMRRTDNW